MRFSTARVASSGDSALVRYASSSSTALSACSSVIVRSLPAHRGHVVGEDGRAAPQALELLVADRELRELEEVRVDAVLGQVALDVAQDLEPRLRIGGRVVLGEELAE